MTRTPASGPPASEAAAVPPLPCSVRHVRSSSSDPVARTSSTCAMRTSRASKHVLLHHQLRPLGVATLERTRDLAVVVLRDPCLLRRVPDVRLVDERQLHDLPHHAAQPRAPCGLEDRVVEDEVLPHDLRAGRPRGSSPRTGRSSRAAPGASRPRAEPQRDARRSPRAGRAADRCPPGRSALVGADRGAPIRRRVDEPLGLQHLQRFPDGRAADPELSREPLLLQALAGREPPVHDRLPDHLRGRAAGRARERGMPVEDLPHDG